MLQKTWRKVWAFAALSCCLESDGRAWKVENGEKGPEGLWKYHVPHLPCLNARDAFAASFNRLSEELGSGPELFRVSQPFWLYQSRNVSRNASKSLDINFWMAWHKTHTGVNYS